MYSSVRKHFQTLQTSLMQSFFPIGKNVCHSLRNVEVTKFIRHFSGSVNELFFINLFSGRNVSLDF